MVRAGKENTSRLAYKKIFLHELISGKKIQTKQRKCFMKTFLLNWDLHRWSRKANKPDITDRHTRNNIPQSQPRQTHLWHHGWVACSSFVENDYRYPGVAAQPRPESWSKWKATQCCHSLWRGPQSNPTTRHLAAIPLQLLLLRCKG